MCNRVGTKTEQWWCGYGITRWRIAAIRKHLAAVLKVHCRNSFIESPTPDRIVRAAIHGYDERFCQSIRDRSTPSTRARLEALLQPEPGTRNLSMRADISFSGIEQQDYEQTRV